MVTEAANAVAPARSGVSHTWTVSRCDAGAAPTRAPASTAGADPGTGTADAARATPGAASTTPADAVSTQPARLATATRQVLLITSLRKAGLGILFCSPALGPAAGVVVGGHQKDATNVEQGCGHGDGIVLTCGDDADTSGREGPPVSGTARASHTIWNISSDW